MGDTAGPRPGPEPVVVGCEAERVSGEADRIRGVDRDPGVAAVVRALERVSGAPPAQLGREIERRKGAAQGYVAKRRPRHATVVGAYDSSRARQPDRSLTLARDAP